MRRRGRAGGRGRGREGEERAAIAARGALGLGRGHGRWRVFGFLENPPEAEPIGANKKPLRFGTGGAKVVQTIQAPRGARLTDTDTTEATTTEAWASREALIVVPERLMNFDGEEGGRSGGCQGRG
jgi:hypothetical protein